jgi:peptide deformylase
MSVLKIVKYGTPSLQERSRAVRADEIDDGLRALIADMAETMYAAKGIGLAAPQVGRNIRVFVADSDQVERDEPRLHVFINPEIVDESVEDGPHVEGCLSIPGVEGEVFRPLRVTVRALNAQGEAFEVTADDLFARVIQHEHDHLEGVLFPDRMAEVKRLEIAGELNAVRRRTEEESGSIDRA